MAELRDLYQEVILDHNRQPRNYRAVPEASHHAAGHNPLCGDRVDVYLVVRDGRIEEVGFQGEGCAISTASASIMTEALQGRSLEQAEELLGRFRELVTGQGEPDPELGKLAVLAGVRDYPGRVKCATLPWHTLHAALAGQAEASTE